MFKNISRTLNKLIFLNSRKSKVMSKEESKREFSYEGVDGK